MISESDKSTTIRPLADIRAAVLRRRFKAPPSTADLLAELAFGVRDGSSSTIYVSTGSGVR